MKFFPLRPTILATLFSLFALPPLLGQADEEEILGGSQKTLPRLSQGGRTKVNTGDGKASSLAETAKAIWDKHDQMIRQLRTVPRGSFGGGAGAASPGSARTGRPHPF